MKVSVTRIGCWFEVVSSKHSNIGESPGISILHTVNLSSINCNSEINLKNAFILIHILKILSPFHHSVFIKECKLGRLGCIGFVFRILQQQPEYEERRSSCAEQESSLSSLAATRQHVFLPPSALLSRHPPRKTPPVESAYHGPSGIH